MRPLRHAPPAAFALVLLLACSSLAAGVQAQEIPGYPDNIDAFDPREVAMLPGYCKYTQVYREKVPGGNNPVEVERWYRTLGPTFHALHHYCNGLMRTHRALILARSERIRKFNLSSSITEFDYVIDRAPRDFVLLPEILTKKGENLLRLNASSQGVQVLEQAIELKSDYWPPYAALADFYSARGNAAKAREYLQQGLEKVPDTKALTRRLAELDQGRTLQRSSAGKP